jgi:UPF0755 protein
MRQKKIIIISIIVFLALTGTVATFGGCKIVLANNISTQDSNYYLYIKTGSTYSQVVDLLKEEGIIKNMKTFQLVAKWKKYPQKIRAGRYLIKPKMNNNELVNMLRSGRQEAVNFTFNNIRTKEQFAKRVAEQLEMNEEDLLDLLNDNVFLASYNLNSQTALTLFIPNTYQLWWNTSAEDFVKKMYGEYEKFWTESRKEKAAAIPLTPTEVIILASIVEEENYRTDEQARIAGVYMNRLKKGIPLQADPTVKFALQDFGRQRLLYADLAVDSPYNTYKHTGLPPGQIRIPSPQCIDNVLNYEHHNYIFMCAKEDFSGYHNFAVTNAEHEANARKYHNALNNYKIKR